MINIRTIKKLQNNDGLTLKGGKCITYKSGYQVATEGIETTSPQEAIQAVRAYGGNCGVWFENGIYYIDKSHRVTTKKDALQLGREKNLNKHFTMANNEINILLKRGNPF